MEINFQNKIELTGTWQCHCAWILKIPFKTVKNRIIMRWIFIYHLMKRNVFSDTQPQFLLPLLSLLFSQLYLPTFSYLNFSSCSIYYTCIFIIFLLVPTFSRKYCDDAWFLNVRTIPHLKQLILITEEIKYILWSNTPICIFFIYIYIIYEVIYNLHLHIPNK